MTALRAASIALVLVSCSHLPLSAQDARTRAAGLADGRAAAEDGSIAPAFIVGLIGGIPIGISGAHYLGPDSNEASATPALAGAAILIGGTIAVHLTSRAPQASRWEQAAPGIDEYGAGFREGYESRLRSRRRGALTVGGLVGMGVGVVAYSYLRRLGR